jgi:hypothetical protein
MPSASASATIARIIARLESRFAAGDPPIFHLNERLKYQMDLAVLQRRPQADFQRPAAMCPGLHLRFNLS